MTSKVLYHGDLRTTMTHLASGNEVITDAPVDNHGRGEAFSPTDIVSTALASCMMTVMGIKANQSDINIDGMRAEVTKIMSAELPRRIAKIEVTLYMPERTYTDRERQILEHTARTCPVGLSLHPDLEQDIRFVWH